MADLSIDLRRRIVDAYLSKRTDSYEQTAEVFGVGRATVSRLLRRYRETGDVQYKPKGGNHPRRVDLDWLAVHAQEFPDARLIDRIEAWEQESSRRVGLATMSMALRAIGWSFKKTPVARERDESANQAQREQFMKIQPLLDAKRLVFVDESGFRLDSRLAVVWTTVSSPPSPRSPTCGRLDDRFFATIATVPDLRSSGRPFLRHHRHGPQLTVVWTTVSSPPSPRSPTCGRLDHRFFATIAMVPNLRLHRRLFLRSRRPVQ